jgi:thiosulfate reductase cytochrome b subunit
MADWATFTGASETAAAEEAPRHSLLVRITHWTNALAFFGLVISGIAILLAHPRLYWGETGAVGMPSLLDLPLPFMLTGQSGWGRYLHFLSAWVCVIAGAIYIAHGIATRHFANDFAGRAKRYSVLQGLTYLGVVIVVFPLIVWTGLAMSPAITSVFPFMVTIFGGQQSARTIHFAIACLLVCFFGAHVVMVAATGFLKNMRAMILGT